MTDRMVDEPTSFFEAKDDGKKQPVLRDLTDDLLADELFGAPDATPREDTVPPAESIPIPPAPEKIELSPESDGQAETESDFERDLFGETPPQGMQIGSVPAARQEADISAEKPQNVFSPSAEDSLFGAIGEIVPEVFPAFQATDTTSTEEDKPEPIGEPAPASAEPVKAEAPVAPVKPARSAHPISDAELHALTATARSGTRSAKVRFCLSVFLAMAVAVLELFPQFGIRVTVPLGISRIRGAEALLDLQLLFFSALLAWPTVLGGLRGLFSRRFRSESILVISVLVLTGYDIYLYCTATVLPILCSLPLTVALAASVALESAEQGVRYRMLGMLSGRGVRYAASTEEKNGAKEVVVLPARHIDGYTERINTVCENGGFQIMLLFLSLLAAGGAVFYAILDDQSVPTVAAAGLSAFFMTVPFSALFARQMFLLSLNRALLDRKIGVFGEEAIYRGAEAECFAAEDRCAFSPEQTKIRVVNVFGDSRLDEILHLVSGIYRKIGGPLASVLAKTGGEAGSAPSVTLLAHSEVGITAESEGHTVLLGDADYLERNGCATATDSEHDRSPDTARLVVMYCAVDGILAAKFYLEYCLDPSFELRAEQFRRHGGRMSIFTSDPNLSDAYLKKISYLPENTVSISFRPAVSGEDITDHADCDFFSADRPLSVLDAILAFRTYVTGRSRLAALKTVETLLGAALAALGIYFLDDSVFPVYASALCTTAATLFLHRLSIRYEKRLLRHMEEDRASRITKG